jgi:hypothetical protein
LQLPALPSALTFLAGDPCFPLVLPARETTRLELIYTPLKLREQQVHSLELVSDRIGNFSFTLAFELEQEKMMDRTVV